MNNQVLIQKIEDAINNSIERTPFNGGAYYTLKDGTGVTINYPTDQIESSLINHILKNPNNHQASIG